MTTAPHTDTGVPLDTPPAWANSWMKRALTTPGIQRVIGRGVALLSFDGRKSGRRYTIPVSYHRAGDVVTVVTKRQRTWWRNFESPTTVELRLAGRVVAGEAVIEDDELETAEFMERYLESHPIDAKAYGLSSDEVTPEAVAGIVPHIVMIRIVLDET